MDLLVDGFRQADQNNPKGYFEFEKVKKLPRGDYRWLISAQGKGVKVISALLEFLPDNRQYRVIFMERDIDEILASQKRMLKRTGREAQHPVSDQEMRDSYKEHLAHVKAWLSEKDWIRTIFVSYNDILREPEEVFQQIASFLDKSVNPAAMAEVVEPALYREQNK